MLLSKCFSGNYDLTTSFLVFFEKSEENYLGKIFLRTKMVNITFGAKVI